VRETTPKRFRHRRAEPCARPAAERAELLCSLPGMEIEVLEGRLPVGTASAADLLIAVAAREDAFVAVGLGFATPMHRRKHADANRIADWIRCWALSGALMLGRGFDAFACADDRWCRRRRSSSSTGSPWTTATQCQYWSDAASPPRANSWSRDQEGAGIGPVSLCGPLYARLVKISHERRARPQRGAREALYRRRARQRVLIPSWNFESTSSGIRSRSGSIQDRLIDTGD